jgi:hypothetical protein
MGRHWILLPNEGSSYFVVVLIILLKLQDAVKCFDLVQGGIVMGNERCIVLVHGDFCHHINCWQWNSVF